jgi:hypothetical protein
MFTKYEINFTGRANLIDYLARFLKPEYDAERFADVFIDEWNGEPGDIVEVRGFDTISGNPVTYSFSEQELTERRYNAHGDEIA